MSAAGVNHVSRKVERPLDVVWEVLEYCANTVIFLLAGALVAARVYTNLSNPSISDIKWFDFPMALALWAYLLLARAAMFVLFWPVLKRSGYGMTPRQGLVLAWSGLRGAVGLALSLFVVLDFQNAPGIADRQFGELCFFYMGAITLLTLLVQGVSMAPLLRRLGMTKPPSVRRSFLKLLLRQVESRGDECMRLAAEDKVLGDPDWRVVGELSALEASEMLKRYDSGGGGGGKKGKKGKRGKRVAGAGLGAALVRLVPASLRGKEAKRNEGEQQQQAAANGGAHSNGGGGGGGGKGSSSLSLGGEGPSESGARGGGAAAAVTAASAPPHASALGFLRRRSQSVGSLAAAAALAHEASIRAVAARMNRGALLAERRSRLLAAVRQTYNDLFHDAFIDSGHIYALRTAADRALDDLGSPLSDWERLAPAMALPSWLRSLTQHAGDLPLASSWARARLLRSLDNSMTLALAFMHAHEVTASDILDVWGDGGEFGSEERRQRFGGGGSARASGLLAADDLDLGSTNPDFSRSSQQQGQGRHQQHQRPLILGVHDLLDEMKANVTRQVLLESAAAVRRAAASVARARAAWPEVARAIKTRQLAQELLLLKEQRVEAVAKTGLIADAEVEALQGLVERKLKSLHFRPPRSGGGRPLDGLRRHPLLAPLSPPGLFDAEVAPCARLFVADEGEVLSRAGSPADSVVVVIRGCVLLQVEGRHGGGGDGRRTGSGSVGVGVGPCPSGAAPASPTGGQFSPISSRPTSAAASPQQQQQQQQRGGGGGGMSRGDSGASSAWRKEAAFAAAAALLSGQNSGNPAVAAAAAAAAAATAAASDPATTGSSATGGGGSSGSGPAAAAPPPVALAAAGAVLFAWPVMLRVPHAVTATAASVTLGYRLPARAFEALLRGGSGGSGGGEGAAARDAVARCAWQAAAAELAVAHGGPSLAGRSLEELSTLFRAAHVEDLEKGDTLRSAGAAFMVYGRVTRKRSAAAVAAGAAAAAAAAARNDDSSALCEPAGPCMLPEEPAAYVCESRCKVMHLPTGCLEMRGGGAGGAGGEFGGGYGSDDEDDSDADADNEDFFHLRPHAEGDEASAAAALSAWHESVERDQIERRRQGGGGQQEQHLEQQQQQQQLGESERPKPPQPTAQQLLLQQRLASAGAAPSAFSGCAPRSAAPDPRRGLGRFEPGSSLEMPSGDEALLAVLAAAPAASGSFQQQRQLPTSPLASFAAGGDHALLTAAAAASQQKRQWAQQQQRQWAQQQQRQQPGTAAAPTLTNAAAAVAAAANAAAPRQPKKTRHSVTAALSRAPRVSSRRSFDDFDARSGGGGGGGGPSRAAAAASRIFGGAARRFSSEAPGGALGAGSVGAASFAGAAGVGAGGSGGAGDSAATLTATSGRHLARELAHRLFPSPSPSAAAVGEGGGGGGGGSGSAQQGPPLLHPVRSRGGGGGGGGAGSDVEA